MNPGDERADSDTSPTSNPTTTADPYAILRTRSYVALLVFAALIGVPIAAVAYFFLALVADLQKWIFTTCPTAWGPTAPRLVAYRPPLRRRHPGRRPRTCPAPVDTRRPRGSRTARRPRRSDTRHPRSRPSTLSLGVVLGPEAPLIALGAGLGALRSGWSSAMLHPGRRR